MHYVDIWGTRSEKYTWLFDHDISSTDFMVLVPDSPFYFFTPYDESLSDEYEAGWKLTDLLPTNVTGVVTARDRFVVDFDDASIETRIKVFLDHTLTDQEVKVRLELSENYAWRVSKARKELMAVKEWRSCLTDFLYRPFDIRRICFHPSIVWRTRDQVMHHMLAGENIGLVSMRQVALGGSYTHFGVSRHISDGRAFYSNKGIVSVAPLYLYPDPKHLQLIEGEWPSAPDGRIPNLNPKPVRQLVEYLGLAFVSDGCGDLSQTFGPEDVFHYAYAVFHSPAYRTRYAEFLKIDFPRVPLTSDLDLFRSLCTLGADLVALHLLEDDYPAASWNQTGRESPLRHPITAFVEGANGTAMGAFSKSTCYEEGKVYLDTSQRARSSYFDGVPEDVWNFHIGGYQVCRKWLYDRRGRRGEPGRTLTADDIAHYQRIVVAIKETTRLMEKIDRVIPSWPLT